MAPVVFVCRRVLGRAADIRLLCPGRHPRWPRWVAHPFFLRRAGHSLALDGNILALGFVLMTIVIVIVVWAYCVRRTKPSEQDLHAALVDDDEGNSPGYIAVGMTHAHDRPGTYVNDTYAGTEMLPMNAHAEKPRTEESHMGTITPAPWGDRWDAPAEPSFYDSATSAGADGLNAENAATGDLSNAMAGLGGETES